jgi:hypothetical protein
MGLTLAAALSAIAAGSALRSVPPACKLLTTTEASKLLGFAAVMNPDDSARADFNCRFDRANAGPTSFDGLEITTRTFSDGPTAHAYFPRWVIPVPPAPASMTLIPVAGVGDTATIVHSKIANSIFFQKAAVLVKMGTHPGASDSALKVAGKTMASRM